ncbi:MAG: HNH endonuclease [Isosphaeraceae bacterium]
MKADVERRVWRRAQYRCEYRRLPQSASRLRYQIDHIIAQQHEENDDPSNLAIACIRCNLQKGSNIAGLDPATRELTRLYNPRRDRWCEHFAWEGAVIIGLTPIGRTTVRLLVMNDPAIVATREVLIDEGRFPPR